MKNKIVISIGLLLATTLCFAQQSKPITELPAKGTLMQTSTTEKVSTGDAATVTEGKKGLNAVNVKRSKQSEPRANGQTAGPPTAGSAEITQDSKHAINTKGTGANNGPSK